MFLTISAPISGADMGYLLLKNPARVHSFDIAFGKAHVFYPELSDAKSTACLLIDIDPVGLVRGRSKSAGEGTLDRYVNDRPYVSSSFLSVAMSRIFGTAMGGPVPILASSPPRSVSVTCAMSASRVPPTLTLCSTALPDAHRGRRRFGNGRRRIPARTEDTWP